MDGMLSQEEINALLGGMGEDGGSDSSDTQAGAGSVPLSSEEKDAIGEISNISMGTAATTLSTLLNQKVLITTPMYLLQIGKIYRSHMTGLVYLFRFHILKALMVIIFLFLEKRMLR